MGKFLLIIFCGLLVWIYGVVSVARADPSTCSKIAWDRPTTYVNGDALPENLPAGYKWFFSTEQEPTKENSKDVVLIDGAKTVQADIPIAKLGDGTFYVRGTAFNQGKDGPLHSPWSNVVGPFVLQGGICYVQNLPGAPGTLRLQ